MLYALCGVSNSGKTTVLEATLQRAPYLARLVTSTTRPPRPGEVAGRDYHFLTPTQFQTRLDDGSLICPIVYRGERYATSLADLRTCSRQDTLAVLRPDKLAALEAYTPLVGIYLEMQGQQRACAIEDQIILAYQAACSLRLTNIPGHLDHVVTTLLAFLHAPRSGRDAGRLA